MKVALIGYGYWGQVLAKYLEKDPFFELVYIYTQKVFVAKATQDLNLILKSEIAAVFIATPTATHFQLSKQFLKAGKHVFCEKPFTFPNEIDELSGLSKNSVFLVNYIYLNSPSIQLLKKWLPKIGKIQAASFSIQQYGKFYANENSFETLGCHLLAVFFDLFPRQFNQSDWQIMSTDDGYVQNIFNKKGPFPTHIHSSLCAARKGAEIALIGENGNLLYAPQSADTLSYFEKTETGLGLQETVSLDEKNNIIHAFNHFKTKIRENRQGNADLAKQVAEILKRINDEQSR